MGVERMLRHQCSFKLVSEDFAGAVKLVLGPMVWLCHCTEILDEVGISGRALLGEQIHGAARIIGNHCSLKGRETAQRTAH